MTPITQPQDPEQGRPGHVLGANRCWRSRTARSRAGQPSARPAPSSAPAARRQQEHQPDRGHRAGDGALQPHENVVPLVRTTVLDRQADRLRTALDGASARVTTQALAALNRTVEVDRLTPAAAAARWWDAQ